MGKCTHPPWCRLSIDKQAEDTAFLTSERMCYNSLIIIKSTTEYLLSSMSFPRLLSKVVVLATLAIIGVFSLIISTLYSTVGINSMPILIEMWYACAIAFIPIIALLVAVWLIFLIAYAPVACAASVKRLNTPRKKTLAEVIVAAWCYLILARCIHFLLAPILTERLRTLTHRGLPSHLALGWHAGMHSHLA